MNIPIPFTYFAEDEPEFPEHGLRAWRYVLDVGLFNIGWHRQVRFNDRDWFSDHASGWGVEFHFRWKWGEDHFYYDGEHCLFHYGFITLFRGGDHTCKKCWEEG